MISGGTATLLAEATAGARAAASENTVRYAGGWTLDGISDEVVAGPGQLEHNVLFQGRPPIEGDAGSALALSALLRLPTGLRLYAEGALREGGFETAGEVEFRDAAGRTRLALAPARVYEQHRPEQAIVAGYRFEPQDAVTWRVTMTTPAAWWLAADRTFPVVWDPAFAVVGSVQMTEIQGPGLGLSWLCYQYDAARVGGVGTNSVCGERRLLVKFNGLSPNLFPPGFAIERAQLGDGPERRLATVRLQRRTAADRHRGGCLRGDERQHGLARSGQRRAPLRLGTAPAAQRSQRDAGRILRYSEREQRCGQHVDKRRR